MPTFNLTLELMNLRTGEHMPLAPKKNRPRICYRKDTACQLCGRGQPFVAPESRSAYWQKRATKALREQWCGRRAIGGPKEPVTCSVIFYVGRRQRPDIYGLEQAMGDALEAAGVVSNDYWIGSQYSERHRDVDRPRMEICLTIP